MIIWSALLSDATTFSVAFQTPAVDAVTGVVGFGSYLGPITDSTVKNPSSNYIEIAYPSVGGTPLLANTDLGSRSILVGFHVQLIEGRYSEAECNQPLADDFSLLLFGQNTTFRKLGRPYSDKAPGNVVFDSAKLIPPYPPITSADATFDLPDNLLPAKGVFRDRIDIPGTAMVEGLSYTARARAILAYPFTENDGVDSRWYVYGSYARPYYTRWGAASVVVNKKPTMVNLTVNNIATSPKLSSKDPVIFGFTMKNEDGPLGKYRVQVGGVYFGSFNPTAWDSGWISVENAKGIIDLSIPFQGVPLPDGKTYAWRVRGNDSLSDGPWSDIGYFSVNSPPDIRSLKIDGNEILFGDVPKVQQSGATVSWVYFDREGSPQDSYSLFYRQQDKATETEITAKGTAGSVTLPAFDAGKTVYLRLVVSDGTESTEVTGSFMANGAPLVSSLLINGQENPMDVVWGPPIISWTYQDDDTAIQTGYRIQVASDMNFLTVLWDTGQVISPLTSVPYGGLLPLPHGTYFVRVSVYDGISWSLLAECVPCFFAINQVPTTPTLLAPVASSYSGPIEVRWLPSTDPDGDTVTYTIDVTSRRSSDRNWKRLVGPLPAAQVSYVIGAEDLPSGDDYGVRVTASDGMANSTPAVSQRFVVENHAPISPIFSSPQSGDTIRKSLRAEWVEASPPDIDGDVVVYALDISSNSSATQPTWIPIGTYRMGTTYAIVDVSALPDSSDYRLRITAIDEHGMRGTANLSAKFVLSSAAVLSDVETFQGEPYITTSDGRLLRLNEALWQVQYDWANDTPNNFTIFSTQNATYSLVDGEIVINNPTGETLIFREDV